MADVYLAVAKGLARFNKLVVVKCLRKRWLEDEGLGEGRGDQNEFVEMFLEEAQLAARLNHPNIVQTNEVGEESGDFYIAMEYLEGQPLNRIIARAARKERELPLQFVMLLLCETLAGLHHAHELKDYDGKPLDVVHRDASPHNIFITYEGQAKVVDFGIAKATTRSFETRTGVLKGKIHYMAPEQARCSDLDRRADLFTIGVVLWELVAKKRMWATMGDIQILQKLVTEPVPSLTEVVPDVDPTLAAIIAKATSLDPADRYATADEMRRELAQWSKAQLPAVTSSEIGAYVADLFADKRTMVAQIIEQQFAQIRRGEEISLKIMDPPTYQGASRTGETGDSQETSSPSRSDSRRREGPPTLATVATSQSMSGIIRDRPRRTALWIGMGVAVVGAAALVASMTRSEDPGVVPTASMTEAPGAAPAGTPSPTGEKTAMAIPATAKDPSTKVTKLVVKAKPADAKIFIDDVLVTGNPYTGNFLRDTANHRVRVEADGHQTEKRLVAFDDTSKEIEIELSEKPTPGVYRPRPPRTATPAVTATSTATATQPKGPGKPPKRELDKNNPYAVPNP